ncbi:flagellar hook-length control protein FliK [Herbaspirillum lusitanum]|uniref:Flagellar hook-length control protein FliK n=1 Tax=Herbaspirillum lusitanum TaxID=213312 RepID=A0ABW9A720_9BURK
MNTPLALLNVISGVVSGTRSSAPQADSMTADVPFNQVLNSQVNGRNSENQSKEQPKEATPAPAAAAKPASSTTSTASADAQKDEAKDEEDSDGDDTSTAASAQMLALVANLQQNAVKPVAGKGEQGEDATLLAKSAGKKGLSDKSLLQDGEQVQKDDGKAVDFSSLQDAANGKTAKAKPVAEAVQTDAAASAKTQAQAKPGAELQTDSKTSAQQQPDALNARAVEVKPAVELTAKVEPLQNTPAPTAIPGLQQAMAAIQPQAVTGVPVDKLMPSVGSAGWDQAVGQKVVWMVAGGQQTASLTLNPPDLGPLQVVIHVNNSQADATFITQQPEVKQALEAAMPKLREMMDQAGIQLGQATVNTGMPNQQQGASQQQSRNASRSGADQGTEGDAEVALAASGNITSSGQGLVDTFA